MNVPRSRNLNSVEKLITASFPITQLPSYLLIIIYSNGSSALGEIVPKNGRTDEELAGQKELDGQNLNQYEEEATQKELDG